jgi:hypothetical protein
MPNGDEIQKIDPRRRRFLRYLGGISAAGAGISAAAAQTPAATAQSSGDAGLPSYARAQNFRSLKQSSYDRTGGNHDSWRVEPGQTQEVFNSDGPGIISHMWFTIAAQSGDHLKEVVLRMYWEGNNKPSVETPVGDFFGLNLGQYFIYQSAFLNCSAVKALNSYFAMPFRKSARITVTNEGQKAVNSFYSNIDYKLVPNLPDDIAYFHAEYRQATPNQAQQYSSSSQEINKDGRNNYTFFETRGKGHLMGITLGVAQNSENWFGEGDEMIFIDDENAPAITGTGTEDYICGAWDFGGKDTAIPFAHLYNGAPYIAIPERTGGRYCLYRWHADAPVTFNRYMKHTIEHGHADNRHDCYYSVAYWYQSQPYTDLPKLPSAADRIPKLVISS